MRGSKNWEKGLHDSVASTLPCDFMFILLLCEFWVWVFFCCGFDCFFFSLLNALWFSIF